MFRRFPQRTPIAINTVSQPSKSIRSGQTHIMNKHCIVSRDGRDLQTCSLSNPTSEQAKNKQRRIQGIVAWSATMHIHLNVAAPHLQRGNRQHFTKPNREISREARPAVPVEHLDPQSAGDAQGRSDGTTTLGGQQHPVGIATLCLRIHWHRQKKQLARLYALQLAVGKLLPTTHLPSQHVYRNRPANLPAESMGTYISRQAQNRT